MPSTCVIAFCGLPGSGKSLLANALQVRTGWQRLDRDALRGELFTTGGYSRNDKQQLTAAVREKLREMLRAGESVILDGMTFSLQAERNAFARFAAAHGARWQLVWLECDIAIAKQRVTADVLHPAADRNAALVDEVAARFQRPVDALRLDAKLNVAENLSELLAAIEREVEVRR